MIPQSSPRALEDTRDRYNEIYQCSFFETCAGLLLPLALCILFGVPLAVLLGGTKTKVFGDKSGHTRPRRLLHIFTIHLLGLFYSYGYYFFQHL